MSKTTIDGCNCWPNDIPFVSNFTDPKTNKLLWNGLDQNGSLAWCNVPEIISKLLQSIDNSFKNVINKNYFYVKIHEKSYNFNYYYLKV
jgi:hypothetical protein